MPRLFVIENQRSYYFPLTSKGVTIGRENDCGLVLVDKKGVARRHCRVEHEKGKFFVEPLDERRPTQLEGRSLEGRTPLESGQLLMIGETKIYFLSVETELGILPRKARQQTVEVNRSSQLAILLEVTKALNSVADQAELLELIMEHAVALVGAERGFLILFEAGRIEFKVARNMRSEEFHSNEFSISKNIIHKVQQTGQPIVTTNARDEFWQYQSLADEKILSLIVVPLKAEGLVIGSIYLDSQATRVTFTKGAVEMLSAFADQAAVAIHRSRLEESKRDMERIQQELLIASQIQQRLCPKKDPEIPHLRVHGKMLPAKEVGGDYYDFIASPDSKHHYLAIGDVSGKGVGAGLIMVMVRSTLRPYITGLRSTRTILVETNRLLSADIEPSMFMSLLLLRWDVQERTLNYCGAGHERLLIFRNESGRVEDRPSGGIVLGAIPEVGHMLEETSLDLDDGDTLLLYTDGVTEARNPKGEEFGLDRLKILLEAYGALEPRHLVDQIIAKIAQFVKDADQHDDITLVALKRV